MKPSQPSPQPRGGTFRNSGPLRYAGKGGTGYDTDFLTSFGRTLKTLEHRTPPLAGEDVPDQPDIHWVRPEKVGEVGFTEWSGDNKLRHPRFIGLRRDKDAADVVREGRQ